MGIFADFAPKYYERGFSVIPVKGKLPLAGVSGFDKWRDYHQPPEILERFLSLPGDTGIGVVLGQIVRGDLRLIAMDIDSCSPDILALCPGSPSGKIGRRGETRYFLAGPWLSAKRSIMRKNTGDPDTGKELEGVEFLCNGGYTVEAFSLHPDTGERYRSIGIPLLEMELGDLPELTEADFSEIAEYISAADAGPGGPSVDLKGIYKHPDRTRCPHGSQNRLKKLAAIYIANQKSIDEAVHGLLAYDDKHHRPLGYFSDRSRSDCKSDPYTNALKFYANIMGSVNRARGQKKLPPQVPHVVAPTIEMVKNEATGLHEKPQAEVLPDEDGDWDDGDITKHVLWDRVGIERTEKGKPYENLSNALRVISNKPKLMNAIWYDEFHKNIFTTIGSADGSPVAWSDVHTIRMQEYMQSEVGLWNITQKAVKDAVVAHARSRPRNEVKEWLETLPEHDGKHRLGGFFNEYMGAEQNAYTSAVGRNFFISLVARVMKIPTKVDTMVILEGAQGIKKSTALRAIVGTKWFGEATADIHTKDFMMSLNGAWLIEIPELDSMMKAEPETIKRVLSTQSDKLRVPYGASMEVFDRTSVFAGTTNAEGYLKDATGNRRFWPIECTVIDVPAIERDREQLFAEALALYRAGATWYEVPAAAEAEAAARAEHDPWEQPVAAFIKSPYNEGSQVRLELTGYNILRFGLSHPDAQISSLAYRRVKAIMLRLGYRQDRHGAERKYIKKTDAKS